MSAGSDSLISSMSVSNLFSADPNALERISASTAFPVSVATGVLVNTGKAGSSDATINFFEDCGKDTGVEVTGGTCGG